MNEIYIVDGKKYRVGLVNKDSFLSKNPTAELFVEEEKTFGPQDEGKTSTTETGTTVDANKVSDTESQSEDGSSELTAYKDLTDEQKKQLNKQKKVDLGNSPEEIAERRKISRAEQADILSTDIELDEVIVRPEEAEVAELAGSNLFAGNSQLEQVAFYNSIEPYAKSRGLGLPELDYYKDAIGTTEGPDFDNDEDVWDRFDSRMDERPDNLLVTRGPDKPKNAVSVDLMQARQKHIDNITEEELKIQLNSNSQEELNSKVKKEGLKHLSDDEKNSLKKFKRPDDKKLYDSFSGNVYDYDKENPGKSNAPAEVIEINENALKKAATTELKDLESQLTKSYYKTVAVAKDFTDYFKSNELFDFENSVLPVGRAFEDVRQLFGDTSSMGDTLEYIEDIAKTGVIPEEISKLPGDHPFAKAFNDALVEYVTLNKAILLNKNPLEEEKDGFGIGAWNSLVRSVGLEDTAKTAATQEEVMTVFDNVMQDAGFKNFDQKAVNEAIKPNLANTVGGGVVDLAIFAAQIAATKKVPGVSQMTRGINTAKNLLKSTKLARKSKLYKNSIDNIAKGFDGAAVFTLSEQLKAGLGLRREPTAEEDYATASFGFSLDFGTSLGGKLLKRFPAKTILSPVLAQLSKAQSTRNWQKSVTGSAVGAASFEFASAVDALAKGDPNGYFKKSAEDHVLGFLGEYYKMRLLGAKSIFFKNGLVTAFRNDIRAMKGLNPLTVSKAAKKYKIEEKEISNPNENTFKKLDDSRNKNVNDLTKQIEKGALTQEEGLIKIQETNKEHNVLEAQAELNSAKASIKAEEKSGINPTDTDIRVLANKLQSGESLNAKDNTTLTNTPLPLLLDRMNVPESIKEATKANLEYNWNRETVLAEILNNSPEFKAPIGSKERNESYKFLNESFDIGGRIQILKRKKKLNYEEDKELIDLEEQFKEYQLEGSKYKTLQEKLNKLYESERQKSIEQSDEVLASTQEGERVTIETKEEFQKLAEKITGSKEDVTDTDGFYDPASKKYYVNETKAKELRNFTIETHETGHFILRDSLKDESGKITEDGIKIIDELLEELTPKQREVVQRRIDSRYRYDKDGIELSKNEYYEEYITVLSDAIRSKQITFKESIGDALEKFVPFMRKNGVENLELNADTGKSLFELIKSFSKGEKAGVEAAIELSKQAEGKEVKGDKPLKSLTSENSDKVNEIWKNQGIAGYEDILKLLKPTAVSLAKRFKNRPNYEQELVVDAIMTGKRGMLDVIMDYNKKVEKGENVPPLSGMLNNSFSTKTGFKRYIDAVEDSKILGEEFTSDIADAKNQVASEETVDKTEVKSTTSKLRRVLGIKQGDAIYDLAKKVSSKILSGELPGKKVKTAVNKEARKSELRKAVSDLMGAEKAIDQQFLNKNILEILKALPASDLVKLERESKVKVLAEQGPRLNVKDAREAVDKGILPKDTNLQSGPKVSSKLPTTLEQAKEFFTQKRKAGLVNVITEMLVKDAAPEVTEGKMDLAIRAKVLSEIDRAPELKFSLNTKGKGKFESDNVRDNVSRFNVGDVAYESAMFKDEYWDYDIFEGTFGLKDGTLGEDKKSLVLAFGETTGETGITGKSTQGLTNVFEVFGIVANSAVDLVKEKKLNSIVFTAKEDSRIRLYNALASKFSKELGWDIYNYPLEGETAFIVYDPKLTGETTKKLPTLKFAKSLQSGSDKLDEKAGKSLMEKIAKDLTLKRRVLIETFSKYFPPEHYLRTSDWTSGTKLSTIAKRLFDVTSGVKRYKDPIEKEKAEILVKENRLLDLDAMRLEAEQKEVEFSLEVLEALKEARRSKNRENIDKNIKNQDLHNKGVGLAIDAEAAIALSSPEAFAVLRQYIYHPSLNANANRNQGTNVWRELGAVERKIKVTDEHVFQAIEHANAKLQLYKNLREGKKNAKESLEFYKKWIQDNYVQYSLKNESDVIKGNLTDAEGNVWKNSGGTSHPVLIEQLYKAIESGTREAWNKVPSSDIRYFNEYESLNPNNLVKGDFSKAKEYNVEVPKKLSQNVEVYKEQGRLIHKIILTDASLLTGNNAVTRKQAKQTIDEFVKIASEKTLASKVNNKKSAFSKSIPPTTNKKTIETASKTDEALKNARKLDAEVKKIRVFDFDDTLARTKSDVLYIDSKGKEGRLTAEEFAKDGAKLLKEGAVFDFSEFNKVTEGKKGPLFEVAKAIEDKRGAKDVFVLTARAPESQEAIYEFLKSQGLNIPIENITGLGNSTGEAKARWVVDKAAEGYNDFYFADDAPQNVKAVREALSVLDVKSKTQQAKIAFSKTLDLNKDFNDIIENKTGIGSDKTYGRVKAEVAGASKGKFNFFIPPSAEDFVGLLYSTLGKGSTGDAQMAWYKAHLLNPYARAMENIANDRANMMQDFRGLKKGLGIVPKNLRKKIKDSNFTEEQAVRAYIWDKQGMEIPGISKKDQKGLVDFVKNKAELSVFADQLIDINKGDAYAAPDAGWVAGNISTDFIKTLNTTKRSKYLESWKQNKDVIFSEANLNKLEAAYGKNYREAMENMLKRMETGKNTSSGSDRLAARATDWLTNSVGAIMFFNTRSAVLQTISAVNFVNFSDNNILKAGQAFANQPQYWSDFKKLFNSPFLLDRRSGLKLNVNEADIAAMAKGPGNSARNVIAGILKAGFLPTQIADSFAIASGGASFYRNRIKALQKEGLTEAEAEEQAFRDFREIAEESQQSSRPDKISQQQAGPLGRVVLAFANTPAQYARLIKKAASDLKNGRGDAKTNMSKIIYYGVAQNLLFSALQQALFAIAFDDEEEDEKKNEKYFNIVNGMSDSVLRGIGVGGAVVSVVKNTAIKLAKEAEKKEPKYQDAVVKGVLQISPPVSSKVGKLQSAGRSFSWNQEEMRTRGWSIDNPAYLASANVISAATNVPLDRAIKKITNIVDAGNEDIEYYKRVALALGWSAWELGIDKKGGKVAPPKTDMDKLYDLNKKQQIDSLLSLGISKKQIKALKLEEDRVKAILDPKSVKKIKVSKRDSLFGLNKKDQVKALEKLGLTKKEIIALRLESDRVEAIINKQKKEVE